MRPGPSWARPRRRTTARGAKGRGPRRPDGADYPPTERPAPPAAPSRVRTPPPSSPRAVYAVRGRLARGSGASRGTPGPGAASGRGHWAPAGWRAGGPIFRRERRGPARSPSGTFATLLAFLGPSRDRRVSTAPPRSPRRRRPRLCPAPLRPRPHNRSSPAPRSGGPALQPARSRPQPTRSRPRRPRLPRVRPRTVRERQPAPPRPPAQPPGRACIPAPAPRPAPHLDADLRPHLCSARAGPLLALCGGEGPSLALSSTTETELTKTDRL